MLDAARRVRRRPDRGARRRAHRHGHHEIRQLAQELGLKLDNLLRAEPNGTEPFYFFDGEPYTYLEASQDLNAIYQKLHRDLSEASFPTLFDSFTERGAELNAMSIVDWIEESVPGGMSSKLGQLLDVAYTIEYGADSSDQAALNLIYLLGYAGQGKFRIFGGVGREVPRQRGQRPDSAASRPVARRAA